MGAGTAAEHRGRVALAGTEHGPPLAPAFRFSARTNPERCKCVGMRELTMENGRVTEARAPEIHDPDAEDFLDLSDAGLVLVCSECDGDTVPVRKRSDPDTVVRCATCGRKHSKEGLRA